MANTPKEFDKTFEEVHVNLASFKALSEISYDEKEMIKLAGGGTAAGVAAGVATAALAPTAAWRLLLLLELHQQEQLFLVYQEQQLLMRL